MRILRLWIGKQLTPAMWLVMSKARNQSQSIQFETGMLLTMPECLWHQFLPSNQRSYFPWWKTMFYTFLRILWRNLPLLHTWLELNIGWLIESFIGLEVNGHSFPAFLLLAPKAFGTLILVLEILFLKRTFTASVWQDHSSHPGRLIAKPMILPVRSLFSH